MKDKKKILLSIIGIMSLVLVTVGVTFAVFTYTKLGTTENTVTTGTLKFLYTENTGVGRGINIENALPVSDEVGKSYSTENYVFDFRVEGTNTSNEDIPYEVTLRKKDTSTLSESNVKVYLTDMTDDADSHIMGPAIYNNLNQTSIDVEGNIEKTLYNGIVAAGDTDYLKEFRLRMWISDTSKQEEVNGKTFTAMVNVYSNATLVEQPLTYTESILNGTDPVLGTNMIPVKIDEEGTVTKADINNEWYKYEEKRWANAVIIRNSYDILNSSGKVNSATLNDGYVSFDGADDYIDLGLANYDFGNSITMVTRFRYTSDKTHHILGNWENGGGGFAMGSNGVLTASVYTEESSGYINVRSTTALEKNVYYTVVATYDGSTFSLYINGVLDASLKSTGTIKESVVNFYLGTNCNLDGFYDHFNGDITEAAIFNRAMTAEEVNKYFTDDIKVYNDDSLLSHVDFTNQVPDDNEVIPEENIESYFVWIPRYKYKIFDEGNYTGLTTIESKEQIIEIEFENKETTPSNGTTKDSWLTHPAFTSFESNGFWVGKFETGYDGATTTAEANVDSVATDKIIIKPNVYSWRNITLGNMFKNSYDYMRELDSHMMKNTEWGAVAYLQHSKYGSHTSIRINNNRNYITGYSSIVESTLGFNNNIDIEGNRIEATSLGVDGIYTINYSNPKSIISSTTGNYTGIYDMSGGAWEYVMGYTTNATADNSGITTLYPDFFSDSTYTKYLDIYNSTNLRSYNSRILGDATGEMGPFENYTDPDGVMRAKSSWYGDLSLFVYQERPWFYRGGGWNHGTNAGSFAFSNQDGGVQTYLGYRIVLTP